MKFLCKEFECYFLGLDFNERRCRGSQRFQTHQFGRRVIYKLLAKVLTNKLMRVVGKVVYDF